MTDPWSVFGDDSQSAGERFELLHSKLVFYFVSRRCDDPEELAHVTLERLMQRHEEQVEVINLTSFCYGIAQNVYYEYLREQQAGRDYASEQEYRSRVHKSDEDAAEYKERRLKCLDECTERLSEQEREMLSEYYRVRGRAKEAHRVGMAEKLGISRPALTLRIFHIKRKLKKCVVRCLGGA